MKLLPLTKQMFAKLDDADFKEYGTLRWFAQGSRGKFYAARKGKDGRSICLHRLLLGAKPGQYVDHANGDSLDNRRSNLRFCTVSQNVQNRTVDRRKLAKGWYKGVRHCPSGRWDANVWVNRKLTHLGTFDTAEEAARAYDRKAIELYGEFAKPNFPQSQA